MSTCSSGCPTPGTHSSWGECIKAKSLQFSDVTAHALNQQIYRESDDYARARADGLQPESFTASAVAEARRVTDATGVPFRADKPFNGQPLPVELEG